jgi:hypothetical protein
MYCRVFTLCKSRYSRWWIYCIYHAIDGKILYLYICQFDNLIIWTYYLIVNHLPTIPVTKNPTKVELNGWLYWIYSIRIWWSVKCDNCQNDKWDNRWNRNVITVTS